LPPSRTTRWLVFTTFAVAFMVMVTGFGPQLKVMTPPSATALTTAAEVQLAGVPLPMTWFGWLVFTARAARGTNAWPLGLPAAGRACGAAAWAACVGAGLGFGAAVLVAAELDASSAALCGAAAVEQAASARPAARVVITTATPRMSRMGPNASGAPDAPAVIFVRFRLEHSPLSHALHRPKLPVKPLASASTPSSRPGESYAKSAAAASAQTRSPSHPCSSGSRDRRMKNAHQCPESLIGRQTGIGATPVTAHGVMSASWRIAAGPVEVARPGPRAPGAFRDVVGFWRTPVFGIKLRQVPVSLLPRPAEMATEFPDTDLGRRIYYERAHCLLALASITRDTDTAAFGLTDSPANTERRLVTALGQAFHQGCSLADVDRAPGRSGRRDREADHPSHAVVAPDSK
jgi:hypothetical protein